MWQYMNAILHFSINSKLMVTHRSKNLVYAMFDVELFVNMSIWSRVAVKFFAYHSQERVSYKKKQQNIYHNLGTL